MGDTAYLRGFEWKCRSYGIDPDTLIKTAGWFNRTASRFDNPIYGESGRKVYKGRWLPFLFPSERRMSVNAGDTYTSLSRLTGVPSSRLMELNKGRGLMAGSTLRVE